MTSAVYDFKAIKSHVKDGDWWKPAKDEVVVVAPGVAYRPQQLSEQYRGSPTIPAVRHLGEVDTSSDNNFVAELDTSDPAVRRQFVTTVINVTSHRREADISRRKFAQRYGQLLTSLEDGIPDRISVEPDDPGHIAYANMGERGRDVTILLDGIEQQTVVTADRAEGWVKRMSLGVDGKPAWIGDSAVMEVVHGKVEFSLKP